MKMEENTEELSQGGRYKGESYRNKAKLSCINYGVLVGLHLRTDEWVCGCACVIPNMHDERTPSGL